MRIILTILLLINVAYGQLNIKAFGARESYADNSTYIQKAIDSAVKTGKSVIIPIGRFKVGKPLIVHNWQTDYYNQVFIKIIGESTFWDRGNRSVLEATFGDAPLLSIQKGKGCIIDGITFMGRWKAPGSPYKTLYQEYNDPNTRDSRWSPYCAIAIDPFMYELPADGGYPTLQKWYRGNLSNGGSTGLVIKNCVFNGFTVGAITSPNGFTQNAELITFENIQIINCKTGFAGCQAQEKLNRIINVGAWGTTHTLFMFNYYGEQTPGHWVIDGVNVAGEVNQILNRHSSGYFPLFMSNIYAESIFQFGYWQSYVGDRLSNSVIDFLYPYQTGELPKAHYEGGGVTLSNVLTRIYGTDEPIVFLNGRKDEKNVWELDKIKVTESLGVPPVIIKGYKSGTPDGIEMSDCKYLELKNGQIEGISGKYIIFMSGDFTFLGYGLVADGGKISYKSVGLPDGWYYTYIK
jgi:hypothetical protein